MNLTHHRVRITRLMGDDVTQTLRVDFGQRPWTNYFKMEDNSGAIQVFEGVLYECPPFVTGKHLR